MKKLKKITIWIVQISLIVQVLSFFSIPKASASIAALNMTAMITKGPEYTKADKSQISVELKVNEINLGSAIYKKDSQMTNSPKRTWEYYGEEGTREGDPFDGVYYKYQGVLANNPTMSGYYIVENDAIKEMAVVLSNPTDVWNGRKTALLHVPADKMIVIRNDIIIDQLAIPAEVENTGGVFAARRDPGWQSLLVMRDIAGEGEKAITTSAQDKNSLCSTISTNWEIFKDALRENEEKGTQGLLSPSPGTVKQDINGKSKNENWIIIDTNSNAVFSSALLDQFVTMGSALVSILPGAEYQNIISSVKQKVLVLSTKGEAKLNIAISSLALVKSAIDSLGNANPKIDISSCPEKIRKLKWDSSKESDSEVYANSEEFLAATQAALDFSEDAVGNLEDPSETAESVNGKCGSMSAGNIF
jgi:hypothetical protein